MEELNKLDFEIELGVADSTDEELDHLTRQLLSQIKELDIEAARLTRGKTTEITGKGALGEPITVGSIAIEVLPAVLPAVIALMQAWMPRGPGRTVKFKGKGIEFEGSPDELQKVLETLNKRKKKK